MSNWRQYRLDGITIKFISFNIGDFNSEYSSDKSLNPIIKNEIANIFVKDPTTIWVVTTQEDATNSTLINIIKSHMTSTKIIYSGGALNNESASSNNQSQPLSQPQPEPQQQSFNTSESRPRTIKKSSSSNNSNKPEKAIKYTTLFNKTASSRVVQYNLHLAVFVPEKLKPFMEIGKTMIEFHENASILKSFAHTKASIITHLKLKIGTYHNLLIVASHLPVDTNDKYTFGYNLRETIMSHMITNVIYKNYVKPLKYNNVSLMWLGDLNFRLNNYNTPDSDQYLNMIEKLTKPPFNNFKVKDFTNIKSFNPTCKTKKNQDKRVDKCTTAYKASTLSDEDIAECYNTEKDTRIPSYCDRILGWNSSKNKYYLSALEVKPLIDEFTPSFYSDHNAISGSLVLTKKS
jgi:hypothetical protein